MRSSYRLVKSSKGCCQGHHHRVHGRQPPSWPSIWLALAVNWSQKKNVWRLAVQARYVLLLQPPSAPLFTFSHTDVVSVCIGGSRGKGGKAEAEGGTNAGPGSTVGECPASQTTHAPISSVRSCDGSDMREPRSNATALSTCVSTPPPAPSATPSTLWTQPHLSGTLLAPYACVHAREDHMCSVAPMLCYAHSRYTRYTQRYAKDTDLFSQS